MKISSISKFSLVSISTLLMSHLAISPVLPKLYEYYHGMNPELGFCGKFSNDSCNDDYDFCVT